MAFVAEPVVGATLGAVPAVDGYFKTIREICNRNGAVSYTHLRAHETQ